MSQPTRKVQWFVWGALAAIVLAILAAYVVSQVNAKALPIYASLPDFSLTNQDNQRVTLDTLAGQVWIADVIFTRCPGQCLIMSTHMKQLQATLSPTLPIKLVSLTTDPGFDSPAVFKKYAERFSAEPGRWLFLTGDKAALRRVEVDGLKLSVVDKTPAQSDAPNDLFIHSEKFVLIDKQGRIRGWYDGQNEAGVAETAAAAQVLARE